MQLSVGQLMIFGYLGKYCLDLTLIAYKQIVQVLLYNVGHTREDNNSIVSYCSICTCFC